MYSYSVAIQQHNLLIDRQMGGASCINISNIQSINFNCLWEPGGNQQQNSNPTICTNS